MTGMLPVAEPLIGQQLAREDMIFRLTHWVTQAKP